MSLMFNSKLNNYNFIQQNHSISEITEKTDYSDLKSNNSPKIKSQYTSPLISYYDTSNKYLLRKYSQNNDLEKSSNFIRKNTFELNQNSNSDYSNDNSFDNSNEDDFIETKTNTVCYQNTNPINQNLLNHPIINFNINNQFNIINSNQTLSKEIFNSMNNTINNNNNFSHLFVSNGNNYIIEMHGKKGWICNFCNNFNYENRNKCNRCKRNKSPKLLKKKNNNFCNKNVNNNNYLDYKKIINPTSSFVIINDKKSQKHFSERIGDWTCFSCKNLNFAFRNVCNRCQLPKDSSDLLLKQFSNINKFPSEI